MEVKMNNKNNNDQLNTIAGESSAINKICGSKIFMYICVILVIVPIVIIFDTMEYNAENRHNFKPYIKAKCKIVSCELPETKKSQNNYLGKADIYNLTIEFIHNDQTISVDIKSNHEYKENSTHTIYFLKDLSDIRFDKPEQPRKLSKTMYIICAISIISGLYLISHVFKPKTITKRYVVYSSDNPNQSSGYTMNKMKQELLLYKRKK